MQQGAQADGDEEDLGQLALIEAKTMDKMFVEFGVEQRDFDRACNFYTENDIDFVEEVEAFTQAVLLAPQ